MAAHRFLTGMTIVIMTFSVLMVSTILVFFTNAALLMDQWKGGIRLMVYLDSDLSETRISVLQQKISALAKVASVRFISKTTALEMFKNQLGDDGAVLSELDTNPLPDALEAAILADGDFAKTAHALAKDIQKMDGVDEVAFGKSWISRFATIFYLFRLSGLAMCGLFFLAAVFIVGNTVRLVLYSRRQEVEIMRLVGATEGFISAPLYTGCILQGAVSGILGVGLSYLSFWLVFGRMSSAAMTGFFTLRFLPGHVILFLVLGGMGLGALGCFLSLTQFSKI